MKSRTIDNAQRSGLCSRDARVAAGRELRATLPRSSHATWKSPVKHRDPVAVPEASNRDRPRLVDQPPIRFHVAKKNHEDVFRDGLEAHHLSLPDDRRVLLDRYHLEDWATKVVGIGSVGTRCLIVLLFSPEGHPLLLQFKEATRSSHSMRAKASIKVGRVKVLVEENL